jgi:ketosteroid isomerase-like protein
MGLSLAACATAEKYEAVLNSWIGHTESELVSKWGPPDSVYVAPDGTRHLTYRSSRLVTVNGTPPRFTSTVIGDTVYTQQTGGTPGATYNMKCTTVFAIRNGRITNWRYEGNDCVSL